MTATVSTSDRKKLPRYPVPRFRLGQLAIRKDRHGQGFGKLLLACAIDRCIGARKDIAAHALIVNAKDENSRHFPERHGFTAFAGEPMTLCLGLGG